MNAPIPALPPTPAYVGRRNILGGGLAAMTTLALSACGSSSSGSTPSSATTSTTPPSKPDKLVVRSWADPWSTTFGATSAAAFTRDTGIKVVWDTTDFDVMDTRVRTAVKAGKRPPVDVHYTIERSAYTADVQGLTTTLDTGLVTRWGDLTTAGRPGSGKGYVNLYSYTQPMIYLAEHIDPPSDLSWEYYWDSSLKGKVFLNSNYEPLAFAVAKILGIDPAQDSMDPVWAKFKELRPNVRAIGDDTPFIEDMSSAEVWTGAMLLGDIPSIKKAGKVSYAVPAEGAYLSCDAMFVPKGLPDNVTYWGQVFINHMLDATQQTAWSAKLQVVPTNGKATLAKYMKGDPAYPFTSEEIAKYAIKPDLNLAARHADDWQSKYLAAIQS